MHLTIRMRRVEGTDPPYDHNFLLGSAVYAMMREHSGEVAEALHDSPRRSGYVLSEIHRVKGKPEEAWFRLGTSSEAVARSAAEAMAPATALTIGATRFQVTGIDLDEPVVRPGEFVTLSPILLRDKKTGKSIVHDSNGYRNTLEDAINAQVRNNLKREAKVRVLHIEPQGVRKRTIKGRTVLAQKGRLMLDGPDEELRFLVEHGVGASPALGFGMVVLDRRWGVD